MRLRKQNAKFGIWEKNDERTRVSRAADAAMMESPHEIGTPVYVNVERKAIHNVVRSLTSSLA